MFFDLVMLTKLPKLGIAIESKHNPTVLALPTKSCCDRPTKFASAKGTKQGGYILAEAVNNEPKIIIIATGSEVGLAMEAREKLEAENIPTRVVSMPCIELFDAQSAAYQAEVLPKDVKKLVIEAGVSFGWHGKADAFLTVDKFGASAPGDVVFKEYGFTVENAVAKAKKLL